MRPVRVEDIMTRDVRSCAADDTLATAAQIMWENDCGAVLFFALSYRRSAADGRLSQYFRTASWVIRYCLPVFFASS